MAPDVEPESAPFLGARDPAPPGLVRLEHHDPRPRFGQEVRRGEPGGPRTHHRHVRRVSHARRPDIPARRQPPGIPRTIRETPDPAPEPPACPAVAPDRSPRAPAAEPAAPGARTA